MIEMAYNKQGAYYYAFLRDLNDNDVICKFDTGAVATIVTAKRLGLSCEQIEAVGEFYYYLILDDRLNKALLGDDFISCCTFNHQPKGSIIITTLDLDLYASVYGDETNYINIDEILA